MTPEQPPKLTESELCPPALLAEQQRAFEKDIERLLLTRRDEFVSVPCPACAGTHGTFIFRKYELEFRRCGNCGTLFMSPRPSQTVLADYYKNAESYAFWAEKIFPASEASRRKKIHEPWYAKIREYCTRYQVPLGKLVEVGAGFGTFCGVAKDANEFGRLLAVEPTPGLAEHCRSRGLDVIEEPIEALSNIAIDADVVVSFEVIEHIFDPKAFVTTLRRILKPGGLLVLSCPNGEGFDIAMLGAASLAVDAEHINLFNPNSLAHLLRESGFEVLESTTPGRLDAEFVRDAALNGTIDLTNDPFLQRVLVDDWETLGWPFQIFLSENAMSSHMWTVARRSMDD